MRKQPTTAIGESIYLRSKTALTIAIRFWFCCFLLAQTVFVSYLILGYGMASTQNRIEDWNNFNNTAFVEGDTFGNVIYGMHVLLAIVMIIGGSLQLISYLRQRFIRFHRINGKVFVCLACIISLAGMYLITVRGTVGNIFTHSLVFFNGLVVLFTASFAIVAIRKKNIQAHQNWAIRLYLAANGVLFFRLTIFAWFMFFGSAGVNTDNFTGPAVYMVGISSYVLPIVLFECCRLVKQTNNTLSCIVMTLIVAIIAVVFLVGLFAITVGNWFPLVFS